MPNKLTDKELADQLSSAYSTDNYANGWTGCVKMLRKRGFNDRQVEAVIRSKWTRWAADASDKPYGKNSSVDLSKFLDQMGPELAREVDNLVRETFEVEATPATVHKRVPQREVPNTNEVLTYLHCGLCLKELPQGVSPQEWTRLEVGFTKQGLQVWCIRHDVNVMHVDFEGQKHPANLTMAAKPASKLLQ